jgi:dienelactone hydrolase
VSCGLWPLPTKRTVPRVAASESFVSEGLKLTNVALETLPGLFLCGTLYRPDRPGTFPGVLNAHGHWADGHVTREPDVPKADPRDKNPAPGRADLVSLAANLARQGFVVFAYDMLGYNDTDQVPHQTFGNDLESWLWGTTELGVQTFHSLRSVDYLCSLPFVDRKKIGVTGASGGGTQTFLLAAIDERIKASAPVNMVSASMQGGCTCENGPGLRVGTDNVELAATFAPRPQLLVCCTGDWTRNVPREESKAIGGVYRLFGAAPSFSVEQFHYQHNFNVESRESVSAFFKKHLRGETGQPETPTSLKPEQLRIKRPAGKTGEQLQAMLRTDADARVQSLRRRGGPRARTLLRDGLATALGVPLSLGAREQNSGVGVQTPGVLLVCVERDERVAGWAAALAAQGLAFETLALPPILVNHAALWENYFSTYNQVPLGERVAQIQENSHGRMLVGIGKAGLWALIAAALAPTPTACESLGFDGSDKSYIERAFAPAWRGLGGIETARWLAAERPLQWKNQLSPTETARWLARAADRNVGGSPREQRAGFMGLS